MGLPIINDDLAAQMLSEIRERLAGLEHDIKNLQDEARAVRVALHDLIKTGLSDNNAAIRSLSTARDWNYGAWWAIGAGASIMIALVGLAGWLLTKNVKITFG